MAEAYRPNPLLWPLSPDQLAGLDDTIEDIYSRLKFVTTVASQHIVASIGGNTAVTPSLISTGTLFLMGGNNVTLSQQGQSVSVSVGNPRPAVSISGNVAGTPALISTGTVFFAGGNNVTLSQDGQSITISAFTQTVQTQNRFNLTLSGNTDGALAQVSSGTLTLAGGDNITLSQAGNAISIVGGAGGGGVAIQVSNSTTFTNGTVTFAAGNNITLSSADQAITIHGAAGAGGVATISQWPADLDFGWAFSAVPYTGSSAGTGGSTQFTASGHVWSVPFPYQLEFRSVNLLHFATATANGTASATVGHLFGIYTLNANTALSLVSSFVWTMAMSQNSITARSHRWGWGTDSTSNSTSLGGNVSASFSGARAINIYGDHATLPAGNYYMAHLVTNRTTGANVYNIASVGYMSGSQTTNAMFIGENTTTSPAGIRGVFSTTTNISGTTNFAMPGSIATSVITGSGNTTQWRRLQVEMYRVGT